MNIIKRFCLWWQARRGSLTDAQFIQLCQACADDMTGAEASIMETYLRYNVPTSGRIRHLYINGDGLSRMYLKFLYLRDVTEQEQYHLVNFMKWQDNDTWPCYLSIHNIRELFDTEVPRKIAMYAAKYKLPEEFEVLLLNRCMHEDDEERQEKNSYYSVLNTYLLRGDIHQKFRSVNSQRALLALNDNKVFKRIIKVCTIDENIIQSAVIDDMICEGNTELLRYLLRETFIESAEQRDVVSSKFLSLRYMAMISALRKEIRKIEQKIGEDFGAFCPTKAETEYITQSCRYDLTTSRGRQGFTRALMPVLQGTPSPHLCAWVAYHFPELEELAYQKTRELCGKLINKYK